MGSWVERNVSKITPSLINCPHPVYFLEIVFFLHLPIPSFKKKKKCPLTPPPHDHLPLFPGTILFLLCVSGRREKIIFKSIKKEKRTHHSFERMFRKTKADLSHLLKAGFYRTRQTWLYCFLVLD